MGDQNQATRLFIGNLSWNVTAQDLEDAFSEAGNVESAKVITDRDTGRSRGFGFVEYSSGEEAQKAIDMFHETELDGRKINVNEARPQERR